MWKKVCKEYEIVLGEEFDYKLDNLYDYTI